MMSAACFWPMPWMYWSAISTRLLVGIFTPAIRATNFSPVAKFSSRENGYIFVVSGRCPQTRTRRPPPDDLGARHRLKLSDLDAGLLKDESAFRQPSPGLKSAVSRPFSPFFWQV